MLERTAKFQRVGSECDILFDAAYEHGGEQTCDWCSVDRQETRQPRESEEVFVHGSTIATGNQVMRSVAERDKISAELGGVLCFGMEAAGPMSSFLCLAIHQGGNQNTVYCRFATCEPELQGELQSLKFDF
ncbi:hypothetical protein BKA63DRAFT_509852 [Paraphoma chrysanthemicola]|nr:hypothetical protein BKA63DRAFT_509852 [Paraphoma chrysanthemicola]